MKSLKLDLKLMFYRILSTKLGHIILSLLSSGIYVKNFQLNNSRNDKQKKDIKLKPFIVVVTIDTESGYVASSERRIWQKDEPNAFIGFYKGIENWRSLLNRHNIKATFLLSTQCFSAKGEELRKIISQLNLLNKENHEIGLHLHPDSDFAVQRILGKKLEHTSAKFYDYKTKKEMVSASRKLLIKNISSLKNDIVSFRWGNWGLDTESVKILQQLNFKIDASATPGIKGHLNDDRFYDWSGVDLNQPWFLSTINYKDTKLQDSKVLEMPIATFSFLGFKLRADPVNLGLLKGSFDYFYKNAPRETKPFVFLVISHSPEATYINGKKTKVIDTMEELINHSKRFYDVRYMSLKEAADYFLRAKAK